MLKAVLQKITFFRVCLLITIIMVMILYNDSVDGALTRRPADTTAMVGDEVVLKCSTDLTEPLYWARRLHGTDDIDVIFQADTLVERHIGRLKVTKNEVGAFDLHILNATLAEAGNYYCVDDDNAYKPDGQDKQHIELAIVDSILNCTHNINPDGMLADKLCGYDFIADRVNISCNVRYRGRNAPSISLTHHLSNGTKVEPDVGVTQSSADGLVVKNASLCVKDSFRGSHFVAAVSLNSIKQWTSPNIEVLYIHVQENLHSGNATKVTIPTFEICSLENNLILLGSDVIRFNWINNNTGFIEDSNHLQIMEYHENLVGEYTCMMHFNFKGRRKIEVIKTVIVEKGQHVPPDPEPNWLLKAILAIQIIQILIIIAVILFKMISKRRRPQCKCNTSCSCKDTRKRQSQKEGKTCSTSLMAPDDRNILSQPDKTSLSVSESSRNS